jgi:membrane-associated protein
MIQLDLGEVFLEALPLYGPRLLGLVALICALGVPLPMQMLVLGAGALAHEGRLAPGWAIAGCLAGSLAGETFYYAAGHFAGGWVERRLAGPLARPLARPLAGAWQDARRRFRSCSGRTVYLTRFALTPLGIPTSVVAGGDGYAYWRFAGIALAGDLVWILGYGAAGYLLGPAWPGFASSIGRYGGWIAGLAVAVFALSALWPLRTQVGQALTGGRARPAQS